MTMRKWLRPYWFWMIRAPFEVTFHLLTDHRVRWNRVIGFQIGSTFVGMVRSSDVLPTPTEEPTT